MGVHYVIPLTCVYVVHNNKGGEFQKLGRASKHTGGICQL